jgi:hypothetical protein
LEALESNNGLVKKKLEKKRNLENVKYKIVEGLVPIEIIESLFTGIYVPPCS